MNDQKLPPFDRLKSILNDGNISDKAYDNIDKLFSKDDPSYKETIWQKIKLLIKKLDSKIFTNPSRKWNSNYHKR